MWLPVSIWTLYGPLGGKYIAWFVIVGLSLGVLQQQRAWARCRADPAVRLWLLLLGWLALSMLWSPAPWPRWITHLWMYSLPLGAMALAMACPQQAAQRALRHFGWASGGVGLLLLLRGAGWLPDGIGLDDTLNAEGNQRILISVLLGLGAAICLWQLAGSSTGKGRMLWLATAVPAIAGLATQDRRTGMLLLPLLLLAWAIAAPRHWAWRAATVAAVLALAVGLFSSSAGVQARFAEGAAELRQYESNDLAATSWGQRLRMLERSRDMVSESPWVGHGLGSWKVLWDARVPAATPLAANSTPHNEYLLLAVQGGLPAALLFLAWLCLQCWRALRAGHLGMPALMVWLTLALGGLANAVLRDVKFALPLLVLAGVAAALARPAGATFGGPGPDRLQPAPDPTASTMRSGDLRD